MNEPKNNFVGRAANSNPASRFDAVIFEEDQCDWEEDAGGAKRVETNYVVDDSQSIVSENNSPDLQFRFSLNPYRGCVHGCSYCYARTYHEFLGLSAGLDFETKISYKPKAATLFRKWLDKQPKVEPVNFSGATDCYQPVERQLELTRQCISVALECKYPITIITKNAMVLRDLDLLTQLAERNLVHVNISLTSLDQSLTKVMEPRTSSPKTRLRAIEALSANNVPTRALLSPIIPGLNDFEIPNLIRAARKTNARAVRSTVLRLPGTVQDVFLDWLRRTLPDKARMVESRIRQIRGGDLHDPKFGSRMSGTGVLADQIQQSFRVFAKQAGFVSDLPALNETEFVRPQDAKQLKLF